MKAPAEILEDLVQRARAGDPHARDQLIRDYTPFVLKAACKASKKPYLVLGRDDEASLALMAFDEAIAGFDPSRGISLFSFAEMVIRRRITDFYRKERFRSREIPISNFAAKSEASDAKDSLQAVEVKQAMTQYALAEEAHERRAEIQRYRELLSKYHIDFDDLVRVAPRHRDARERAIEVARMVAENPEWREYFLATGCLPLARLAKVSGLSRKTLERKRKYIIAVALILAEDFSYLAEYVRQPRPVGASGASGRRLEGDQ